MLDFRFYFAVFLRRLPYFSILVAIGLGAGLSAALVLPPTYEAEARMIVESEQISEDLIDRTLETEAIEQLQIIQQRILTRDTLLDMANRLNVYRGAGEPDEPMSPDETVEDMRERIIIETRGGTVRRGQTEATIVNVSFTAPTGQMAANVTNEVVTLMLAENVEMRTGAASDTLAFFNQRVDQLEQELSQITAEILSFQEANLDSLPDSLEFRRTEQAAAQERLLEHERAENILKDRRERLVTLYEQTGSIDGLTPTAAMSPEEQRLQQLRVELSVFAPDNPRTRAKRAELEALEEIVAEQKAAQVSLSSNGLGAPLTELDVLLADIDGELEFIATQKAQQVKILADLAESIAATPANAVALDAFERKRANLRAQYDEEVRKRAVAQTGEIIESGTRGQRITIIEQAVAPDEPTSPNRPRIAALGLIGGFGMGFGFIFLLEFFNTKIRRPIDLINGLEITPLVTLPYIRTNGQVWRRRLVLLIAFLIVLIGIPAALWYIDTNFTPLQPLFERVLNRMGL